MSMRYRITAAERNQRDLTMLAIGLMGAITWIAPITWVLFHFGVCKL